ncbi:MAG: TetR/AcrR family transcriptional regulator [Alphaproteobacteria bacterium]|nr:TetR/AcrR family transcriptional regulator [Alphaproteobacteria bacterium]
MARPYKSAEARRAEILAAAVQLFTERGYANTSVQAIIDALDLSKGAFYHHFRSKDELLDALTEQLREAALAQSRPAFSDPDLTAPARLLAFFDRLNAWKLDRRSLMLDLGRALYDDANLQLLVRHRRLMQEGYTPLLAEVIAQGVREGCWDVVAPLPAAEILWQLIVSLGEIFMPLWMGGAFDVVAFEARLAAHLQAIERLLGAPAGSLPLVRPDALRPWLERPDAPVPSGTPLQRSLS